jgi:hypothetical protein
VTAVDFFDESYLRWVDSLQRRRPSFGLSFVQTFGSAEISEVILGAPAVLFVTKMEISDEQVNICGACLRDSLELLSVSQLKLPGAKRRWLHCCGRQCKSLATTHPASWDAPSRGCDRVDDLLGHQVIAQ